jgi:hypothetical protein
MMSKVLRAALAVSIVALSIGVASPAAADVADCAGSRYTEPGYEIVDVPDRFIPPPLRGTEWDCAIHIADWELDDDWTTSNQFVLIYADITFDELIDIFRRFERTGYAVGTQINLIDNGQGSTEGAALGAEDLAAMDPQPNYVGARFSNAQDGGNIYEFTYTDGVEFASEVDLPGRPSLYAGVILTQPYLTGTELTDPSVLSSLRTIGEAAPTPAQTAVICGTSVFLMLIVGYPGALLNSVIGSRYDQFMAKLRERRRAKQAAGDADPDAPRRRAPGWLVWPGFFAAAVIGSFVDPNFGFNWMSARLLVTAFWAFVLLNLAGWTFVRLILQRLQPDAKPYIRFRWGSLALVALAVAIARLLQFEPGIIFGLVAGLAFGITLAASRDAQVILLGSGFALAIALIGWVGYSLLAPVSAANPGELWAVFFTEFFSGITVEGISALPLALLPLFALDGAALFAWKKWVWAIGYAVGLAAFMLVLLTIPAAWGEVQGDFLRWTLLFVAFGVVAVAVWAINGFVEKRKKAGVPAPTPPAPTPVEPPPPAPAA